MGGIYAVRNKTSGKQYIGSTKDLRIRKNQHFSLLRRGKHYSQHLQRSFNKYGEQNFEFVVLEMVEDDKLCERERHWIETTDSTDSKKGFNLTKETDAPSRGRKWSAESRKKLSESIKMSDRRGSKHPMAKIYESTVWQIFSLSNYGFNQKDIAERIGIDQTNVSLILRGKAWAHVGLAENRKTSLNNKSGCTGVYYDKKSMKWKAEIIRNGIYHGLGYFTNKEEAILTRKQAEVSFGI